MLTLNVILTGSGRLCPVLKPVVNLDSTKINVHRNVTFLFIEFNSNFQMRMIEKHIRSI